jgi:hypothetical protein
MNIGNMVFRSVYVDPDVDRALRDQADKAGVSKGEMFRRYLEQGMAVAKAGGKLSALPAGKAPLTMRTVYLPFRVDESLRGQAFELRTSKSDLLRQFLRMGMQALRVSVSAGPASSAKKGARRAAAVSLKTSAPAPLLKGSRAATSARQASVVKPAAKAAEHVAREPAVKVGAVKRATAKKPVRKALRNRHA